MKAPSSSTKKSSFLLPAAVIGASLVVALLLGEIALRIMGFSAPVWYRPDREVGWTLRPGTSAWFTKEGRALVRINADGRRDREATLAKPEGVYRIVVLGDSYSEAMQVEREQAFWSVLPERLASCGFQPGKRIEVLNFGVSGYGTAQEYLTLKTNAIRYRPDLVLLQFTNGNDVRNNSFALEHEKYQPFYVLDRDGTLRRDDSFAASQGFKQSVSLSRELARRATDHSRVLQLVRSVRGVPVVRSAQASDPMGVEQGLEPWVLTPPKDRAWQEAWQITEGLMGMTAEYAKDNGARFMVFTVPYAVQVHPDRKLRAALAAKLGVDDLLYPDLRLAEFGRKHGIDVLTLAPVMQRMAEERNAYYHGFPNIGMGRGHWNADGHRVAADLIAQRLCEK